MKTALVVIATGEQYRKYADELITSVKQFFVPCDVILFTDELGYTRPEVKSYHYCEPQGFPRTSLFRYHIFVQHRAELSVYDYIFYADADMLFVAPVTEEEIFSDGITACLHPGYVGTVGTPDRNSECKAYIPQHATNKYFCGGFNGGKSEHFLWMAGHIKAHVDEDDSRAIKAVWNDESHLNAFLYYNCPPAKVLSPSFCYPESEYKQPGGYYRQIWDRAGLGAVEPKLLALDKVK